MKKIGQLPLAMLLIFALMLVGTPLVAMHNQNQNDDQQAEYLETLKKGAIEFEIAATTLTNYQIYDLEITYHEAGELSFTNRGEAGEAADTAITMLKDNQPFCNAMLILGEQAIADSVHVSEAGVGFSLKGLNPTDKVLLYFDPNHQMDEQQQQAMRLDEDWVLVVEQQ
ncbi:hypothetical protein [Culicoidibacter larvae]|uniref:Uncharacterized protein n=1 Tax=Culicoidibacter larvae TaxID=2579976 RepID=A0A5R8QFW6_9FIRM|nr:hypothetical protein [Culicoidibacter larvae]TLG76650.1 hypothetical protein FEZ08_03280 [Culicoidibacter larvae]